MGLRSKLNAEICRVTSVPHIHRNATQRLFLSNNDCSVCIDEPDETEGRPAAVMNGTREVPTD